jgi:hypothetical protein
MVPKAMSEESPTVGDSPGAAAVSDITPIGVFHEAAIKRLDIQIETFHALDSRAATALSIGSVTLPITFGLLGFSEVDIPLAGTIALGLAGASYAVLLGCAWLINSRTISLVAGEPITILSAYVDAREYSAEGLQGWLAKGYEDATVANEETLVLKGKYVGRASNALYAESLCLSVAAILTLAFG